MVLTLKTYIINFGVKLIIKIKHLMLMVGKLLDLTGMMFLEEISNGN
jgi:hypothetical protein